jgi:hypothetical protein
MQKDEAYINWPIFCFIQRRPLHSSSVKAGKVTFVSMSKMRHLFLVIKVRK